MKRRKTCGTTLSASRKQPLFRTPASTLQATELFSLPQNAKDMVELGLCREPARGRGGGEGGGGGRPETGQRQKDLKERLSEHVLLSKGILKASQADLGNSQSDLLPAPSQNQLPNIRSSEKEKTERGREAGRKGRKRGQRQSQSGAAAAAPSHLRQSKQLSWPCW